MKQLSFIPLPVAAGIFNGGNYSEHKRLSSLPTGGFTEWIARLSSFFHLGRKNKLLLIMAGFILLVLARLIVLRFHFNLGYLYVMIVCLSAFWFGIRGGLAAAAAASGVFFIEVMYLSDLPSRNIVLQTIYLRFLGYAWAGIITAVVSEQIRSKASRKNLVISPGLTGHFLLVLNSPKMRIALIALSYALIEIIRLILPGISLFLDYSTVILICVSGFWFGLKGGLIAATTTFSFFLLGAYMNPETIMTRYFLQNLVFSFFFCYIIGIFIGVISEIEGRIKNHLQDIAYRDELTGCVNYRFANQVLDKEISRAARHKKNLTLIVLDIDDFKRINDHYGHKAGNDILRAFAESARDNLRTEDTIARFGGDEFIILLPETPSRHAIQVLEKIQAAFTGSVKRFGIGISFSAGISCYPQHGFTKDMLFCAADNALAEAKKDGKNQFRMERRDYIRLKPAPGIQVCLTDVGRGRNITGFQVENLSRRGMLILLPEKSPIGRDLKCVLRMQSTGASLIEMDCRVVYKSRSNAHYRVGIYFQEIPREILEKITVG